MTELYVAASGWRAQDLESMIPPACRRGIDRAPAPVIDGENAVVDLPEWSLGPAVRHLLPSFSALGDEEYSFRFEMSVRRVGATWSAWVGAASLGPAPFEPISSAADGLTSDVDVFVAADPVDAVRLRLRLRTRDPARLLGAPWFLALSACDPASREAGSSPVAAVGVRLPVPVESQMERPESIRLRICSPTSVAMVLGYWGRPVEVPALAAAMFHAALDLYGVWPAAIQAAGRRGVAGYLLRFPDWSAAAWCLDHGLPVIASVRYGRGELEGAAVEVTPGHLLVLTGYEGDHVLVNDPAAGTAAEVARRYRHEELCQVWLGRAGIGYVLFPPRAAG